MRRILILLLLLMLALVVPVSANYNSSGTVDYSYGYSSPYVVPSELSSTAIDVHHTDFAHRFTDAQVINSISVSNTFTSSLSYTKSEITPFTATVSGTYYGSGYVSLVEQLDGDVVWTVDFDTVDTSYAQSLTGIKLLVLSYDLGIWNGVNKKSGTRYYHRYESTLTSSVPTSMVVADNTGFMFCYIGSPDPNILLSYSMSYTNSYDYSFNSSSNISTMSIDRSSDGSLWSVYDSTDYLYFEDQVSYSITAIDQSFIRRGGVYANTTFDIAPDPVSIYTLIDLNGTVVVPDAPPGESGFDYNISTELDEYSPGDTVNVTYTTDQKGTIQVVDTHTGNVFHSIGFIAGATNATWQYYISDAEDYGFFDVYLLDSNEVILDSFRYTLLPQDSLESYLHIVQSSANLYDEIDINVQTANASIFTIENPNGVEVWNDTTLGAQEYRGITFTPTVNPGVYTAYLYDDATLSDTIIIYSADAPPITDPDTNETIIEDVIDEDETMNEYFDGKFREFAPAAWGIFLLAIVLWLVSILSSFGGSGSKRRR